MIFELHLKRTSGDEGVLVWDTETGKLTGFEAEIIRIEAEEARKLGYCSDNSGLYAEGDPLHDPRVMAVLLLDMGFDIPEQLVKYLPKPKPGINEEDY